MLNNHGFSMKQMILYFAVLLIALFFVVYYCNQLIGKFGDSFKESVKGNVTYATIERSISVGALAYMDKYYKDEVGTGTITVLASNLVKYNILHESDLITSDKDSCDGYVLIRKGKESKLETDAYISCNNYITTDYQSWRIGD